MSTPKRLLDSNPDSPAAVLLRAGLAERAPSRLPRRILAGLSAGVAANATVSVAAGSVAIGSAPAMSVGLVVAKWCAIGMLSGGLLSASAVALSLPPAPDGNRSARPTLSQVPKLVSGSPAQSSQSSDQRLSVSPQPSGVATSARASQSLKSPALADSASGQLGREIRFIDSVRSALAAGDARGALQQLSEYQALAVTGVLDREARVLRIECLVKVGELEQATQLAAAYLQAFPGDAHGPHLRSIVHLESAHSGSIGAVGDMNSSRSPIR
jgi:hypothetical protein